MLQAATPPGRYGQGQHMEMPAESSGSIERLDTWTRTEEQLAMAETIKVLNDYDGLWIFDGAPRPQTTGWSAAPAAGGRNGNVFPHLCCLRAKRKRFPASLLLAGETETFSRIFDMLKIIGGDKCIDKHLNDVSGGWAQCCKPPFPLRRYKYFEGCTVSCQRRGKRILSKVSIHKCYD
jgi:hypothetical protein